jgi:hypothetical protein
MGGGPPLSGDPLCGGGPGDCPMAAPDAQAIHSRPARGSHRAVLPQHRVLVGLDNVFAPSRRGSDDLSVAVLRRN